jgi:hypothetical protein
VLGGDLLEQRCLQRAGDGDRRTRGQGFAVAVEFTAAELVGGAHATAATLFKGRDIERHRLLAGTGEHETIGHD